MIEQFDLTLQGPNTPIQSEPGVIAMKGYSRFRKSLGLEPHYHMQVSVKPMTLVGVALLPYRGAVSLFYHCSWQGKLYIKYSYLIQIIYTKWFKIFLSNTNNCIFLSNNLYLIIFICLWYGFM